MVFKSNQIRFLEMDDALDRMAVRAVPSGMNEDNPFPSQSYGGFGPTSEF
jgi:hypothetical protein